MTALLWLDEDREWIVRDRVAGDGDGRITLAWPRGEWKGADPQLVLIVARDHGWQPAVVWLALARPGRVVSTFERSITLERFFALEPPLSIEELSDALPPRHRRVVERHGPLPPGGGRYLVEALLSLRPDMQDAVSELTDLDVVVPTGRIGELLAWEKDATGTLLEIGGVRRDVLRRWRPSNSDVPFLVGLPELRVHENTLIDYDASQFAEWIPAEARQVGWRVFASGAQRMFVMNANATSVEHTLGVDLVYFNEARGSLVLVQYKKLVRDRNGAWHYRPKGRLISELTRMRKVDEQCARSRDGEFRLLPTPCWVKLCRTERLDLERTRLLEGMYLARPHFEQLLEDPSVRGPKGGVRLDYDTVDRHLSNSLFTDLVRDGWIGSTGTGTAYVADQIRRSLTARRAVVVGVHSDEGD
jgi:hypothetical protein